MLDGQMEAADGAEVARRLQEQGHLPVEAKPAGEGGGARNAWRALPPSLAGRVSTGR
jgi:general secretion pathway protein F